MKLRVNIHKIKCVEDLTIELPVEKGLYAITGQNGSGKSTIVACASSVFFNLSMHDHFGKTESDSFISFELDSASRSWKQENGKWRKHSSGNMNIKGFYEGSLIYGNRFKDTSIEKLKGLDSIDQDKLIKASNFIRENLGLILQGDKNFYEKLYFVSHNYDKFDGDLFFYEKNGKRISQFHMSTGENLLISILNSIYIRNKDRASLSKPCIFFLDEIELALHPSSLKRLVNFLTDISKQYNYAIYFSTHSLELIGNILPQNIFYIERHADNSIEIMNPCYPAYATRMLYDDSGFDAVILVEDELAREIVRTILREERLLDNRLVHVLPCGGYANVIELAQDVVRFNLLGRKRTAISLILDRDIKENAEKYIASHNIDNSLAISYLPIPSLEKYLREKLFLNVDHKFFRFLSDYVFQRKSLTSIIEDYKVNYPTEKDRNGKILFGLLDTEIRERRIDRSEFIGTVMKHIFEVNDDSLKAIVKFMKSKYKQS